MMFVSGKLGFQNLGGKNTQSLARSRNNIVQDGLRFRIKIHVSWASLKSVTTYGVAIGWEMVKEKTFKFREKSGYFILSQEK